MGKVCMKLSLKEHTHDLTYALQSSLPEGSPLLSFPLASFCLAWRKETTAVSLPFSSASVGHCSWLGKVRAAGDVHVAELATKYRASFMGWEGCICPPPPPPLEISTLHNRMTICMPPPPPLPKTLLPPLGIFRNEPLKCDTGTKSSCSIFGGLTHTSKTVIPSFVVVFSAPEYSI